MIDPTRDASRDDVSLADESHHVDRRVDPEKENGVNDSIRARAHQLYLDRGDTTGDDVSDWLRAEREIREQSDPTAADVDVGGATRDRSAAPPGDDTV